LVAVHGRAAGNDDGAGRHQLLAAGVHSQVQALQRPGAEQLQVARLPEHDLVCRQRPAGADHRESDRAHELLSIGHDEAHVPFFGFDADPIEVLPIDPGHFAAGVDDDVGHAH